MESLHLIEELKEELRLKDFELSSILEIIKGINDDKSVDDLLSIYDFVLREKLNVKSFILYKKDGSNWDKLLKSGFKGNIEFSEIQEVLLRFKNITFINSSTNEILNDFDVALPIMHKGESLSYLLLKQNETSSIRKRTSDLSFIQMFTNIMIVAIENKRMNKESLVRERIKKELEVASELQKMLFPSELPSDKRLDLAADFVARHEVGGDYYDFIPINEHEFIVCIADVSGKGIGAAMIMANFQATLRTLLSFKMFDLKELILTLNERVIESANGEKFITFFIARYNSQTRKLKYINAGHNHPILTDGKRAIFLGTGSVGLGMLDEIPFIDTEEISIAPNSTLVLYTDGVVELQNKTGEYFQTNRLIKLIHSFYPLKMEDMNNIIFSKLDEFREKEELTDDTAIFSCRIF